MHQLTCYGSKMRAVNAPGVLIITTAQHPEGIKMINFILKWLLMFPLVWSHELRHISFVLETTKFTAASKHHEGDTGIPKAI